MIEIQGHKETKLNSPRVTNDPKVFLDAFYQSPEIFRASRNFKGENFLESKEIKEALVQFNEAKLKFEFGYHFKPTNFPFAARSALRTAIIFRQNHSDYFPYFVEQCQKMAAQSLHRTGVTKSLAIAEALVSLV